MPGWDAIGRAVARRVPRRSGVRRAVPRAKTSGRDGPEHPAAVDNHERAQVEFLSRVSSLPQPL